MPENASNDGPDTSRDGTALAQWVKQLAAAAFAVFAVVLFLRVAIGPPKPELDHSGEAARLRIASSVLAAAVRDEIGKGQALLLTRPAIDSGTIPELVEAVKEGLEEGFGGRVKLDVAAPEFTEQIGMRLSGKPRHELPDMNRWMPPLGTWFDDEVLAAVAAKHADCDVIVSMVGLPDSPNMVALQELPAFAAGGGPRFAVVDGPLPEAGVVRHLFQTRRLIAAVVPQSCWASAYPESAPEDRQTTFESASTLLTPGNLDRALNVCPNILQRKNLLKE